MRAQAEQKEIYEELLKACKRALLHTCGSTPLDREVWQILNKAITKAEEK